MGIKDIYEIANKVERAKLAFTRIANTAFQMNYLSKSLFPSIEVYSNLLPNSFRTAQTSCITRNFITNDY